MRTQLVTVRYAPLAESARIQGDVHLFLNGGWITVVSGHRLLAQTAVASAKVLESLQNRTNLDVTYHFIIVETAKSVPTVTTVKRGNAFERAILRVFGIKTEKVVHDYQCEEGSAPLPDVKWNDGAIEIWIYGRTRCPQVSAAALVSNYAGIRGR